MTHPAENAANQTVNQTAKIAIFHTTHTTIEPLRDLANELLPGVTVMNILDDSILPQLRENGGNVDDVEERLEQYAMIAHKQGAALIMSACSSIGEAVQRIDSRAPIRFLRVDEPMAELAVTRGTWIGVAATLHTTLKPTLDLLLNKAESINADVRFEPRVIDRAFKMLSEGNREGHDAALVEELTKLGNEMDVVVLAQASMARVLPKLPQEMQDKFLTSPRSGMERVKAVLEGVRR
jgi:aspartate/glutamate racemase